jgi:hypothetical protein
VDGELDEIKKGAVCVLYEGTPMVRLVRITRQCGIIGDAYWYTTPFLYEWHTSKRVHEDHLRLLNEMEVLAWAAQS